MAMFIWPPEVQWPPPAHILLNYDVVPPAAGAVVEMQGVLRSIDVAPYTSGGIRVINITAPAPALAPASTQEKAHD